MSWIEDDAARQAHFRGKLPDLWKSLKEAIARDLGHYSMYFGLDDLQTKERGDNGFVAMFQEGSDRLTQRCEIHVEIDFQKLEVTVSVVIPTQQSKTFKIVPDQDGNPMLERGGKRFTADEASRDILKPYLKKSVNRRWNYGIDLSLNRLPLRRLKLQNWNDRFNGAYGC